MMVWDLIKLRKAIGVLLDFYCIVHYFKQERGQKRVSTALLAIQNWYSIGLLSPLFFSLVESAILKKIKIVSIKHLKQKLSLENN